jgi:hypothetical protein
MTANRAGQELSQPWPAQKKTILETYPGDEGWK